MNPAASPSKAAPILHKMNQNSRFRTRIRSNPALSRNVNICYPKSKTEEFKTFEAQAAAAPPFVHARTSSPIRTRKRSNPALARDPSNVHYTRTEEIAYLRFFSNLKQPLIRVRTRGTTKTFKGIISGHIDMEFVETDADKFDQRIAHLVRQFNLNVKLSVWK